MGTKFIVVAIGMVIGLALTPVVATQVGTLTTATTGVFGTGNATCTALGGMCTSIAALVNLIPLGYVAAILLTPVYIIFRQSKAGGM